VRDGDAAADAGRAEPLALEQAVEQAALIELEAWRRGPANSASSAFLPDAFTQAKRVWTEQIGDFHFHQRLAAGPTAAREGAL
jgi:hypothetical protein